MKQADAPLTIPAVVFHGTPFRFDRFRSSPSGIHFGTMDQAAYRLRRQLAKLPTMQSGLQGHILQCRLRINRLKQVNDPCNAEAWQKTIDQAKADGFDGLCYENWYETPSNPALSWVVFDPAQIEILGCEP